MIAGVLLRTDRFVCVKFSDDTAIVSLLLDDQDDHGPVVSDFVNWCDESYLGLNAVSYTHLTLPTRRTV